MPETSKDDVVDAIGSLYVTLQNIKKRLDRRIAKERPRSRLAFQLYFGLGHHFYDYGAIGYILGIRPGSAKALVNQVLYRLRVFTSHKFDGLLWQRTYPYTNINEKGGREVIERDYIVNISDFYPGPTHQRLYKREDVTEDLRNSLLESLGIVDPRRVLLELKKRDLAIAKEERLAIIDAYAPLSQRKHQPFVDYSKEVWEDQMGPTINLLMERAIVREKRIESLEKQVAELEAQAAQQEKEHE